MSMTVARSFRVPKEIDDAVTSLMAKERRNRNNMVDTLLAEAIAARKARKAKPSDDNTHKD